MTYLKEPRELPPTERLRGLFYYASGNVFWRAAKGSRAKKGAIAGGLDKDGYRVIRIDGASYKAHRIAWKMHYGVDPVGQIDHINQNKSDNRIENLREATNQENMKNSSIRSDNSFGLPGVYSFKTRDKWYAQITVNDKRIHLGVFAGFFEACCARKAAENKYGFHPNHGKAS